jgi:hypothetical protein
MNEDRPFTLAEKLLLLLSVLANVALVIILWRSAKMR